VGKARIILIVLAFFFVGGDAFAQEVKVSGYFVQDSARLGEKVGYVLKASYSSGINVVFPDSTFDYNPWVFLGKQTFMSHTVDGITTDSAVYYLSNFSLDPVSGLSLPIYQILKFDSLPFFPEEGQLALKLSIAEIPEELNFQQNNEYQNIPTNFDYPFVLMILGLVLVVVLTLFFIFGKRVKNTINKWKEKKKYQKFLKKWKSAEYRFIDKPSMESADEMLGLWKSYMEHLKSKPFREWTTTEIAAFLENKDIVKDFREIEMVIYAGKKEINAEKACQNLKTVCEASFAQKMMEKDESK
jgi:hypothetical protein